MRSPTVTIGHNPGRWSLLLIVPLVCLGTGQDCDSGGGGMPSANIAPMVFADAVPSQVVVNYSATLVALAFDPDLTDTLTYQWTQVAGQTLNITNPTAANASVTPTEIGTYQFQVTVSDGQASASQTVNLVAIEDCGGDPSPPSDPPVIVSATVSPPAGFAGTAAVLEADVYDPNGDPIWYQWSQVSGPTISIEDATSPTAGFQAPAVTAISDIVVRITCGDNHDARADEDVTYTVSPFPYVRVDHVASDNPVYPGEEYYYTVQITNTSSGLPMTGVNLVVTPPVDEVNILSATGGGSISGDEIIWNIASVPPGQPATVYYTVQVKTGLSGLPRNVGSEASVTVNEFFGTATAMEVITIAPPS